MTSRLKTFFRIPEAPPGSSGPGYRKIKDLLDHFVEGKPGGFGGVREERGFGEAGYSIDLQDLRTFFGQNQIDS